MGLCKLMQSVAVILIVIRGSGPFQHGEKEQEVLIADRKPGADTLSENNFIVQNEKENHDDYTEYMKDTGDDNDDDSFDLYEDMDYIADGRSNRRKVRKDSFVSGRVYMPLSSQNRNERNRRKRSGWSAFSWWRSDQRRRNNH